MARKSAPQPPAEPAAEEAAEVQAPVIFEHGLPKAEIYRPLRCLRDALEAAGRPELEHANALLAILEPA